MNLPWSLHRWEPLEIQVGPCAWNSRLLTGPHAHQVASCPSLVVIEPTESLETLTAIAPHLGDLPVAMGVHEPTFLRRLPELVQSRLAAIQKKSIQVLILHPEDEPASLKAGGAIQMLQQFREQGLIDHFGIAAQNSLHAQWMAQHTPARVLQFPFHLEDQSAAYRTLDAARDYGMACLTQLPSNGSVAALRFALATPNHQRVLAVLDQPWPMDLVPMSEQEAAIAWETYQRDNPPPPPLPRSRPPLE